MTVRHSIVSGRFEKKLKKFVSLHPELREVIIEIVDELLIDPLSRKYKSHKLSWVLQGCFGASINSSYRITYAFDKNNVYFLNIGSHDDVY
jgi:addiction module RelE/StbE family toxin